MASTSLTKPCKNLIQTIRNVIRQAGLILLALFLCISNAQADTVWLKNGDKISGNIIQLENNRLAIETDYAGTMYLNWEKIDSLYKPSELKIHDVNLRQEYQAKLSDKNSNKEDLDIDIEEISDTEHTAALQYIDMPPEVDPPPVTIWDKRNWKGGVDLSMNHKIASKRTEYYNARLNTRLRYGYWQHKLDAEYRRKRDDGQTKTNVYGFVFSSDRFITDKVFIQGRAMYKRDHIEDVSRQMALGVGPGYQFWDDDTGAFSISGLIGPARYDYYIDDASETFNSVSLRWDYNRYLLDKDVELYTKGEFMRPLNNAADISMDASIGVRYNMTKWLSWFLDYSRNLITGGRQGMDERRINTGLGVKW